MAQTTLGFKAGVSSSSIFFSNIEINLVDVDINQVQNNGVLIGAVARHFFQKHAGVQLELNYIQKGWTEIFGNTPEQFTTDLNFIEFATLSHFNIGKGRIKPVILAGPRIAFLLSENEQSFDPSIEENITYRVQNNNVNNLLFGVAFGAGVSAETGLGDFQLDFQLSLDLSRFFDPDAEGSPPFSQNQTLLFTVSYFPWKKDK
ncbi:MAG: porin family protein [Bacteroidota bacterium]